MFDLYIASYLNNVDTFLCAVKHINLNHVLFKKDSSSVIYSIIHDSKNEIRNFIKFINATFNRKI